MAQTVLITGASSGIGKAASQLFAAKGWNVVATMRKVADGGELAALGDVLVTRLDVADRDSIAPAIEAGIARFGKIDLLLNNAGYGQFGVFEATPREKIMAQFDVNVFGVMDVTRAMLPHFRANKGGGIINVSSGAGLFTLPMISLYSASKFALEGFSEALAYELGAQNIFVKLIEPHGGVTETNFNQRQAANTVVDDAVLADYAGFIEKTNAVFAGMVRASSMTSADVANVIYGAATDGTERLRYFVGDDNRDVMKARYDLSEDDYVRFMRAKFAPKA
ncbi:MAG TPA: SDR family oxidoreductase [Devosiaceae bacterium]|jgi:NAD(P)-dependent dehydrogenase (short-subunit alcohol dehydrogenase family)